MKDGRPLIPEFQGPHHPFEWLFFVALLISSIVANLGGSHSDLGFRPSQTAITAYYAMHEGFRLDYITPVLGPPWSIPFEFPMYQWLAALLSMGLGLSLATSGRLVSLAFFYGTLPFVNDLIRKRVPERPKRLLLLSLVLLNPIYLFWSTTFLIESTALFFCVVFLWSGERFLASGRTRHLVGIVAAGSMAALVKITTFVPFCLPFACLWVLGLRRAGTTRVLVAAGAALLPMIPALAWTGFADGTKRLNPLARSLASNSPEMMTFNFGTLEMRLDPEVWLTMADQTAVLRSLGDLPLPGGAMGLLLPLAAICLAATRRRLPEALLCLAFFLVGPFVFTNLYFVHDYYFYANSLFLSLALGFVILSLLERLQDSPYVPLRRRATSVATIVSAALLSAFLAKYSARYLDRQLTGVSPQLQSLVQRIQERTRTDDILLIYGLGWASDFPYRTERRALMDDAWRPLDSEVIQEALQNLEGRRIGAMIVAKPRGPDFVEPRLRRFGLRPDPEVPGLYFAAP